MNFFLSHFLAACLLFLPLTNIAQGVGIGTNAPDATAVLDLTSTDRGVLLPRLTTAQRLAIASPPAGLELFDTDAGVKMIFNGTRWVESGSIPIGTIQAWHGSFSNTPNLPWGWAQCNGQVLNDPESPYDGQTLPDLNSSGRFLRGATTSGTMQSSEIGSHQHTGTTSSDGTHAHSVDPPSTNTFGAGAHNHGGSTGSVNWNDGKWYAVDDNPNTNRLSNSILSGDGVQWGTPWDGYPTGGNFISAIGNHTHAINSEGDHTHNVDIGSFNSGSAGSHSHTFTTSAAGGSA